MNKPTKPMGAFFLFQKDFKANPNLVPNPDNLTVPNLWLQ